MRQTWLCFIIYEIIKSGTINDHVNVQVNDQVNVLNIATLFGVSGKTIRRDLYVMRDMNLIHYVGSDKTGHWEVKHGKIHMHQS